MTAPPSVRVLGVCGLFAAALIAIGGFFDAPILVGVSGALMVAANLYATVKA